MANNEIQETSQTPLTLGSLWDYINPKDYENDSVTAEEVEDETLICHSIELFTHDKFGIYPKFYCTNYEKVPITIRSWSQNIIKFAKDVMEHPKVKDFFPFALRFTRLGEKGWTIEPIDDEMPF